MTNSAKIDKFVDRLINQSTPDQPLWNIESSQQGKIPKWNYIDGCMMTALLEMYKQTDDNKYLNFVDNFVDYYVFDDGSLRGYCASDCNLDDINEGRVLFDLYQYTRKEKYNKAINLLKSQLDVQPRTSTGNWWHKKIYPHQIWLDGMYMAQVFYAKYIESSDNKDYNDLLNQFIVVHNLMFNDDKKLYYHGIDTSLQVYWANKKTGLSSSFWLRSIGWYLIALVDILEICSDEAVVAKLSSIFAEAIEGIAQYVGNSIKMLRQVVDQADRAGNYFETSGSCMVCYAMLKGARLSVIDKSYGALGRQIFDSVCDKHLAISDDGDLQLGGICLVAGLGPEDNKRRDGSYEYYISEPVVANDAKGVAPFVLAYTEMIRK